VIYDLIVHCQVSVKDAKKTVDLWYNDRKEVLQWQEERKKEAHELHCVHTLLGRARRFPLMAQANKYQKGHIERAAINTPVQVLNSFYLANQYCVSHSSIKLSLYSHVSQ